MSQLENSGFVAREHASRSLLGWICGTALMISASFIGTGCNFFQDISAEIPFEAGDVGSGDDMKPGSDDDMEPASVDDMEPASDDMAPVADLPDGCAEESGTTIPPAPDIASGVLCNGEVDTWDVELSAGDTIVVSVHYPVGDAVIGLSLTDPEGTQRPEQPIWNGEGVRLEALVTVEGRHEISIDSRPDDPESSYQISVQRTPAAGAVLYLSPTGTDSGDGSASNPWPTFQSAIPELAAGDTLIVEDGVWTNAGCADDPRCVQEPNMLDISCANGTASSGTADAPITIVARHQRAALLASNGLESAIAIHGCSHWSLVGLRAESSDNDAASGSNSTVVVDQSPSTTLRHLLVRKPNRYANSHSIVVLDSPDSVIEYTEIYDFHRWGVWMRGSPGSAIRLSYANSRNTPDIAGGFISTPTFTGDGGFATGDARWVENVAAEDLAAGISPAEQSAETRRVTASLCNGCQYGFIVGGFEDSIGPIEWENIAAFHGTSGPAIYFRACDECRVSGATLMRRTGANTGVRADRHQATDRISAHLEKIVAVGHATGFRILDQDEWQIDSCNAWENTQEDYPEETIDDQEGNITNSMQIEPTLLDFDNGCLVYVPTESNMKGAAADGADIGANIIHRYHEGVETTDKLWDQRTGRFPCGAIVDGVNDRRDESCFGFHERMNVGSEDCPIP